MPEQTEKQSLIFKIREHTKQGDYYYITRIDKKDVVIARIIRDVKNNNITPKHKYESLQSELENVCRKWRTPYKIKYADKNYTLLSDHKKEYLKRYLEQKLYEKNIEVLEMYKHTKNQIIQQVSNDIDLIIDTYERATK